MATISDITVEVISSINSEGIGSLNNYLHVIEDSQFITDLEMLLHYLKHKKVMNEEDVRYTIISIENTIKNGYKLISPKEIEILEQEFDNFFRIKSLYK